MFGSWGRFVYRRRWAVLAASALVLAVSLVGLHAGGTLSSGGSVKSNLEAARTAELIDSEVAVDKEAGSSFLLIFRHPTESVGDRSFREAVDAALAPIEHDARVTSVASPYNAASPAVAQAFVSKDGHQALVNVGLRATGAQAQKDYADLRLEIANA